MAPKLVPGKRPSDAGESSRDTKKAGAQEPTYETFDECMDGGIDAEERGERYRNGEKSQRFYEQASELYAKALSLDDTSYDAAFNLGRVMLRLASEFYLPPSSLDVFSGAMMMFKRALGSTEDEHLKNDAAFNLAQTLISTADVLEEYQGDRARPQAKELRESAAVLLQGVVASQAEYVHKEQEEKDASAASEAAGAKGDDNSMQVDSTAAKDGDATMAEGEVATEEEAQYPKSVPTPDSLVDTVILLTDTVITLWNYYDPPQLPPDEQQEQISDLINSVRAYAPSTRQAELDLQDSKMLLGVDACMWDMVKEQITPGTGMENTLGKAAGAIERILSSLDAVPSDDASTRAEILTTLGDTEMGHALRLMMLLPRVQAAGGDPAMSGDLSTKAWGQLSAAATRFTTAAGLPGTASTPKEFKPSVYLNLLRATLARARLAGVNTTAAANVQKLMDNCAAYATKAADSLGWKFAKLPRESDPQPNPFFSDPVQPPFPAGWDMEMLARDTQLLMLRVCFFARNGTFPNVEADPYDASARAVMEGIQSVKSGPRRMMPHDVERFVSDIEDAEGALSTEEKAFWEEVTLNVQVGVPPEEHREEPPATEFTPAVAEALRASAAAAAGGQEAQQPPTQS